MTRRICSGSSRTGGRSRPQLLARSTRRRRAVVERERLGRPARCSVGRHRARRRHARELRELVDQPLQRLDLADDRVGALLDQRAVRRAGVAAACGCSRSADNWIGRQRVLDLVRQPPRHLAPRRHLLRPDQRRDIVEHQHRCPRSRRRRRRRVATTAEVQLAAVAGDATSCATESRLGAARRRRAPPPTGRRSGRAKTTARPAGRSPRRTDAEQARGRGVDACRRRRARRSTRRRWRCARGSSRRSGGAARPPGAAVRARLRRAPACGWRDDSSPAMALNASTMRAELVVALRVRCDARAGRRRSRARPPRASAPGRVMRLARYRPIQVAPTRISSVTIRKNDR